MHYVLTVVVAVLVVRVNIALSTDRSSSSISNRSKDCTEQISGTACLLSFDICHCPGKDSADSERLIACLDDDSSASAFELVPEKCTYLLA